MLPQLLLLILPGAWAAQDTPPPPAVVLLQAAGSDDAVAGRWRSWTAGRGWRLLAVSPAVLAADAAMDQALKDAAKSAPFDPARLYLAGEGASAPLVFYAVSRMPYRWAAAVAVGGNLKTAIDTNRLFAANSSDVPLYWVSDTDDPAAPRLSAAGFRFERINGSTLTPAQLLDRLAGHQRADTPSKVDCETGTPAYARCYWIEITKFDPSRRNDVLGSTRVTPGSGASLALGGFGYDPAAPGPGVRVVWLPPGYSGPLKVDDRILAVRGKPVAGGAAYAALMDGPIEEGPATVMLQRGKEKMRLETRVLLPKREETITARVQAEYSIESHEVLIVSRNVAALRLEPPAAWLPFTVNWNGRDFGKLETAGCVLLSDAGTAPCPAGR